MTNRCKQVTKKPLRNTIIMQIARGGHYRQLRSTCLQNSYCPVKRVTTEWTKDHIL